MQRNHSLALFLSFFLIILSFSWICCSDIFFTKSGEEDSTKSEPVILADVEEARVDGAALGTDLMESGRLSITIVYSEDQLKALSYFPSNVEMSGRDRIITAPTTLEIVIRLKLKGTQQDQYQQNLSFNSNKFYEYTTFAYPFGTYELVAEIIDKSNNNSVLYSSNIENFINEVIINNSTVAVTIRMYETLGNSIQYESKDLKGSLQAKAIINNSPLIAFINIPDYHLNWDINTQTFGVSVVACDPDSNDYKTILIDSTINCDNNGYSGSIVDSYNNSSAKDYPISSLLTIFKPDEPEDKLTKQLKMIVNAGGVCKEVLFDFRQELITAGISPSYCEFFFETYSNSFKQISPIFRLSTP